MLLCSTLNQTSSNMTSTSVAVFLALVVLALQGSTTFAAKRNSGAACTNVEFVLKSLENCPEVSDPVISVQGFNVTLTPSCNLVPTGCINRKAYKTAKVTYDITKGAVHLKGDIDACKQVEQLSESSQALIEPIKAYLTCPAEAEQMCGDKNAAASISDLVKYLKLAQGNVSGKIRVDHDTGKTCVKFEAELRVKNKGKVAKGLKKLFKN